MTMPVSMPKIVRAAEEAVQRLVAECRKGSPLYTGNPKAVAQVSRTSKWLLNVITRLRREPDVAFATDVQK